MNTLIRDVIKYRKYILYAAKADLNAEVTNAYLDWFWWILEPVCNMLIYYFIFGYVFQNKEEYYLVFIYSAITLWTFFDRVMKSSVQLIRHSKGIIAKVYIPKTIILIQKLIVNLFKMLISCTIVIALMIPYHISVDYHLLLVFPIMGTFFIFTYGCGCFLMHFGVYVDDLSYIVSIILKMLIYFTGVFYSISEKFPEPLGYWAENLNPIAFFIAGTRNALIYQKGCSGFILLAWFGVSCCLAIGGTRLVYKNENNYVKVI